MQVKTFTGKTNAAVLEQIKSEMGDSAIILDTQKNAEGYVVMTAALERPEIVSKKKKEQAQDLFPFSEVKEGDLGSPFAWHNEWANIKQYLITLMQPALRLEELDPRQKLALEYLQQEGACEETLLDIFCTLKKDKNCSVLEALQLLSPVKALNAQEWPEKIHFFSGPFGSGKTTSCLKTALLFRQQNPKLRICIVNTDTQRANGRLFLKHYAELSNFNYLEPHSPMEFGGVLAKLSSQEFDLICVDMPALNRDECLSNFFQKASLVADENSFFGPTWKKLCALHLVLSPNFEKNFFQQLILRYQSDFLSSIIYTKLDELNKFGQILNIGKKIRLPISAFSCSPSLTGILMPAQSAALWRMIFRRELPTAEEDI